MYCYPRFQGIVCVENCIGFGLREHSTLSNKLEGFKKSSQLVGCFEPVNAERKYLLKLTTVACKKMKKKKKSLEDCIMNFYCLIMECENKCI